MLGEDEDDLRDDLRGFPLESRIGEEAVRMTEGRMGRGGGFSGCLGSLVVVVRGNGGGLDAKGDVRGDERGKGTEADK